MSNLPTILTFPSHGASNLGYITVAEHGKNIPFDVARVYWTYYTPNDIQRGGHAHKELWQVLIAVSGTIEIFTESAAGHKETFVMSSPDKGLLLPPPFWHTMRFTHNAVLLSLSSMAYSEADYIRSYDVFKSAGPDSEPQFVPYDEAFLEKSWGWLNDPEIKALTMTGDFTRQQQQQWYEGLPKKTDYKIWGIRISGVPAGVCGLKNIRDGEAEYWGYIGEKNKWGKGIGKNMMQHCLAAARDLGLEKVYLHVSPTNERAAALYKKTGFTEDVSKTTPEKRYMEIGL